MKSPEALEEKPRNELAQSTEYPLAGKTHPLIHEDDLRSLPLPLIEKIAGYVLELNGSKAQ